MDKIKSIIIDDEINNCNNLQNILNRYCPEVEVLGLAHSAEEGLESILQLKPELIFLDIQMPGGSGFDLLDSIDNPTFDVIFVTAYNDFAIKAIRKSAIDYLLKPVNILDLKDAVSRAINKRKVQTNHNEQIQNYIDNRQITDSEKKVALPTAERLLFVKVDDILRCKGENNYTQFFLKEGKPVLVSKTLKEYEELFSNDGFLRVHQSHLVNIKYVQSYEKQDGGYLKLTDGSNISISRQRKEYVLSVLNK